MNYTIIEDCSPYYIRFTHPGIEDIIESGKKFIPDLTKGDQTWSYGKFKHHIMTPEQSKIMMSKIPACNVKTPLCGGEDLFDAVKLFISSPRLYYTAHTDGFYVKFAINYPIVVEDDKCVTQWYDHEELEKTYETNQERIKISTRDLVGFDPKNHTPKARLVAKVGEGILFNTAIFHDWDNSKSNNNRVILTVRARQPHTASVDFDDVKKHIFKF